MTPREYLHVDPADVAFFLAFMAAFMWVVWWLSHRK